jgi:acyl-CoA reductase-like NAD-dependent aldehyde dehydrogenase
MTTHSPVAQVEANIEAEIEDLKKRIKRYENEYDETTGEERKDILLKMITAKEGRLQALSLKALRHQQQGIEPKNPSIHLWFFYFAYSMYSIIQCPSSRKMLNEVLFYTYDIIFYIYGYAMLFY